MKFLASQKHKAMAAAAGQPYKGKTRGECMQQIAVTIAKHPPPSLRQHVRLTSPRDDGLRGIQGTVEGTARRWNERGFGFIEPDDGGTDLFVHSSCIIDGTCLEDGAKVQFVKVYDERKGEDRAEQVIGGSSRGIES